MAGEKVQLSDAAAPANGYRASVRITDSSVSGPFAVSGLSAGTVVRVGEMNEGDATFDRYGRLSDSYTGMMTASLAMTFFVGTDGEYEVYLEDAEPVADVQWELDATLDDMLSDSAAYTTGQPLGPGLVGANSATTATTIVAGSARPVARCPSIRGSRRPAPRPM